MMPPAGSGLSRAKSAATPRTVPSANQSQNTSSAERVFVQSPLAMSGKSNAVDARSTASSSVATYFVPASSSTRPSPQWRISRRFDSSSLWQRNMTGRSNKATLALHSSAATWTPRSTSRCRGLCLLTTTALPPQRLKAEPCIAYSKVCQASHKAPASSARKSTASWLTLASPGPRWTMLFTSPPATFISSFGRMTCSSSSPPTRLRQPVACGELCRPSWIWGRGVTSATAWAARSSATAPTAPLRSHKLNRSKI